MQQQTFMCEKCSGTKKLFIEKRPRAVFVSAFLVVLMLAVLIFVPEEGPWRRVVVYLGVVFAVVPLMSLVRIRCLHCEPEWKDKAWG